MVSRGATTLNVGASWADQGTSIRMDVMSLVVALVMHVPLYYMKFDASKKSADRETERLVSIDLLETLKKEEPAPPPPPAAAKGPSIREKLMKLVRKEPPPPAPVKKAAVPDKIVDAASKIAIQPKLDLAQKIEPRLQTKSGFQTKADAKLIEQKKLALNAAPAGVAPISAKRVGIIDDRSSVKSDKGKFAVGSRDVSDIGGDSGPSLAGAGEAPALQIRTGSKSSVEKFSAAPAQKSDKGRIGGVAVQSVGGPKLGLRDSIIARDAAPTQIAAGGRAGGVAGGVPGGVPGAAKRDAGRFDGSEGGVVGGVAGGRGTVIGGTGTSTIATGGVAAQTRARAKKSMFTITGPLKDRRIEKQVAPEYPAWAQSQGIEASVVLEFTVDPSGLVKQNIVVRRTSGYSKLDETAIRALRLWKFVPLPPDKNEEQVGLITFNYTLS